MVRWPGHIEPGTVSNEIVSHMDWLPTFLAIAGEPDIKTKLTEGLTRCGKKTFKVHLDGYNLLPYLTGAGDEEPAQGVLLLLRRRRPDWLALRQLEARVHAATRHRDHARLERAVREYARFPKLYNLRTDPYERADITSNTYWDWYIDHIYLLVPAQAATSASSWPRSRNIPPRQKAASFTIDQVLESLQQGGSK